MYSPLKKCGIFYLYIIFLHISGQPLIFFIEVKNMREIFKKIRHTFFLDRPIIKFYGILYFIGICIGSFASFVLRNQFSSQVQLLFSPANTPGFWSIYLQQVLLMLLLFLIGLTAIGAPLLLLYPLYKGFSAGLMISLSVVLFQLKGLVIGVLAFAPQNMYYTLLGFFLCYSSAKLSISLSELICGGSRGHGSRKALWSHILCAVMIVLMIFPGSFWEFRVVPYILELY